MLTSTRCRPEARSFSTRRWLRIVPLVVNVTKTPDERTA
jgi:hypothetical protein